MSLYSYAKKSSRLESLVYKNRTQKLLIKLLATVFSLFIFLLSGLLLNYAQNSQISPITVKARQSEIKPTQALAMKRGLEEAILGVSEKHSPGLSPQIVNLTPSANKLITPTQYQQEPGKDLYTIAIIGDSMVDTMGEVLEYLDAELKAKYPKTKFLLYNYGTGAQNIEMGLNRFANHFKYQSRDYPSLPELKPDILIVASFAYNPFTPHDRDKHWLTLTKLVQTAKNYTPRLYMLAEIAPLREDFGVGPQGVNWSKDTNYEHSLRIIQQLENAVGLSKTLGVPLIDAFNPSFNSELRIGTKEYVNPADGIHPSIEGHKFMAKKIAETIKFTPL